MEQEHYPNLDPRKGRPHRRKKLVEIAAELGMLTNELEDMRPMDDRFDVTNIMDYVQDMNSRNTRFLDKQADVLLDMNELMSKIVSTADDTQKLLDVMVKIMSKLSLTQDELHSSINEMPIRAEPEKQIVTDKDIIRARILDTKNSGVFNPGELAINEGLDIDIVMEIMQEFKDEKQLEPILDSSKMSNDIPEGLITNKDAIKQMLLNSKIPNKVFNPGVFAVDRSLDISVVLEVVEELRKEKHLVSANE